MKERLAKKPATGSAGADELAILPEELSGNQAGTKREPLKKEKAKTGTTAKGGTKSEPSRKPSGNHYRNQERNHYKKKRRSKKRPPKKRGRESPLTRSKGAGGDAPTRIRCGHGGMGSDETGHRS